MITTNKKRIRFNIRNKDKTYLKTLINERKYQIILFNILVKLNLYETRLFLSYDLKLLIRIQLLFLFKNID